jgi:hypothetical protein
MSEKSEKLPLTKEDLSEAHPKTPKNSSTATILVHLTLWYFFTALSNVYAKKYMQVGGDPLFVTNVSFLFAALGWMAMKFQTPTMKSSLMFRRLWPVAVLHIGNTYLTNVSMQKSDIKFTYTIKVSLSLVGVISPILFLTCVFRPLSLLSRHYWPTLY